MEQLRRRFAELLHETLATLTALLDRAPTSPQARTEAHRIAHRMVGSSGVVGLTDLSLRFRTLEEALHPDAPPPTAEQLASLLGALRDAGREATS